MMNPSALTKAHLKPLDWGAPLALLISLANSSIAPPPVYGQIVPDATLGADSSIVSPTTFQEGGLPGDRITGGAIRSEMLFHSFDAFNIDAGRAAYFANPEGIAQILGRVTGATRSDILGRLGVEGSANLFLLNPNGIVFGPDATLDVAGSFVATTADRFTFADGAEFSAVDPQAAPQGPTARNYIFGRLKGTDAAGYTRYC